MIPSASLRSRALLAAALWTGSLTASAQDEVDIPAGESYPIDLEMVRPVLSKDGLFAVDSPRDGRRGTWVASATLQYERSPVRVFFYDNLVGRVVAHRTAVQLGFLTAITDRVALSATIPVAVHLGGDVKRLDNNGAGLGDLATSVRWRVGSWGPVSAGLQGTVLFPTGSEERWMGEDGVRGRLTAMGIVQGERTDLVANVGVHLRAPVETEFDFTAGSEFELAVGLRRRLFDDLDLQAEWINRVGIAVGRFGGRWGSEVVGGVRYDASPNLRVNVGIGRGINSGYGTSAFRVLVGLSWVHLPPEPVAPPEPETEVNVTLLPEPEPEPVPVPEPPSRVRIEGEQVVIDDEILFVVDTASLLPQSLPVLREVADFVNARPTIAHLVVEGHASQEGTFEHNHELSDARAETIYRELVLAGVHPARLSYRGMGEVENAVEGTDEAQLAPNRRVQFKIVRVYQPGETVPVLNPKILLPWSGEPYTVQVPSFPDNKVPNPKEGQIELDDEPAPLPTPQPGPKPAPAPEAP